MTTALSRREWLVWCLWVNGASYPQIAYSLGIRTKTVNTYTTRISRKLGVSGAVAAATVQVERPVA